ncbi:MAG: cytochrome c biogenesis protein CcsA, partial [Acidimicrobiia bacterium]
WWDWGDARMTTTALLFFVYLGYLALRRSVPDPEDRARRSSLWGMVAFVQVPLVYFSVNLFRTLHQTQSIRPDGSTMDPGILAALLANIGAFTLLYLTLLISRTRLLGREAEAEAALPEAVAGSTVAAPRLGEATDG